MEEEVALLREQRHKFSPQKKITISEKVIETPTTSHINYKVETKTENLRVTQSAPKVIQLVEASARVPMKSEVEEIKARLQQAEKELLALKVKKATEAENARASKQKRICKVEKELSELKAKRAVIVKNLSSIDQSAQLDKSVKELEALKAQKAQAVKNSRALTAESKKAQLA